ncbi:hypothetical protein D3C81_1327920 [compost metagenome]
MVTSQNLSNLISIRVSGTRAGIRIIEISVTVNCQLARSGYTCLDSRNIVRIGGPIRSRRNLGLSRITADMTVWRYFIDESIAACLGNIQIIFLVKDKPLYRAELGI